MAEVRPKGEIFYFFSKEILVHIWAWMGQITSDQQKKKHISNIYAFVYAVNIKGKSEEDL